MKICIFGKGFVGSAVCEKLKEIHDLHVFASSKDQFQLDYFDLVINCAGISKRYEVTENFLDSLKKEEEIISKIDCLQVLNPNMKIIHISSVCAGDKTPYGDLKLEIENRIDDLADYAILRPGALIGEGLRKNVVFDWIHGRSIRVSPYSIYNFISTEEVASIIEYLINNWKERITLNVGASESIKLQDVFKLRKSIIPFFMPGDLPCEVYNIDVSELQKMYPVKTSKEYLEEFLNGQVA
jgi:nucleoside-diphosphate-sugar epimerase